MIICLCNEYAYKLQYTLVETPKGVRARIKTLQSVLRPSETRSLKVNFLQPLHEKTMIRSISCQHGASSAHQGVCGFCQPQAPRQAFCLEKCSQGHASFTLFLRWSEPLVGTQPSRRRRHRRLHSKTTPPTLPEELEVPAVDAEMADAAVAWESPIHHEEPERLWSWWGGSKQHGP